MSGDGAGAHDRPGLNLRAWWTVVLLGLLFIVSYVDRLALSLLVEPIKADLGVSDTQMGLLLGASFAVFYAVFGLPLSLVADRGNRRWLIIAGALIWTTLTVGSGFATSFALLLIFRLGVGLGEAALSPAAVSMIGDMFVRERRALALAVYVTLGALGASGSFIIAAAVLQWASAGLSLPLVGEIEAWRATLILVGAPGVFLALLFAFTVREPSRTGPPSAGPPLREGWRHFRANARTYVGLFGGIGLAGMITFGSAAWFPTHLVRTYGVTPQTVGYAFGAAAMLGAVSGSFVMPVLADRLLKSGRRDGLVLTALGCIVLTAALYIPAFTAPSFTQALWFAGFATFVLGGLGQLANLAVQLITPARLRGLFTAVFLFVLNILGLGLGPSVVAMISDAWFEGPASLGRALAVLTAVVAPVSFVLLLQARRPAADALDRAAAAETAAEAGGPVGQAVAAAEARPLTR